MDNPLPEVLPTPPSPSIEDRLGRLEDRAGLAELSIKGLLRLILTVAKELGLEITFTPQNGGDSPSSRMDN